MNQPNSSGETLAQAAALEKLAKEIASSLWADVDWLEEEERKCQMGIPASLIGEATDRMSAKILAALQQAQAPAPDDGDAELEAKVENGTLVVRIGIKTLAHAVTYSEWANPYDEKAHDYIRSFAIEDASQFAADVVHAMKSEREDGSTPLSDFIDKMSEAAVNDGSLGLHENFNHRIKHGEKSPLETW